MISHGIKIVPVPTTGRMSNTAMNKATNTGFATLSISIAMTSSTNVIPSIWAYDLI